MNTKSNNNLRNAILLVSAIAFLFSGGFFLYKQSNKTKLDKRLSQNKPIHILLSGVNSENKTVFSVFAIILPKEKKCGLYFINPLSSFETDSSTIESMGKDSLSFLVKKISSISNYSIHHTIQINEQDFEKFLDIIGGLQFYFDNKEIQSKSFRWTAGDVFLYSGEIHDFLGMHKKSPADYVERMNRQLSIILTLYDKFQTNPEFHREWLNFFHSKIKTDITATELFGLFEFFTSNHIIFSTSELPGELQTTKKSKDQYLLVKEDTAKISFRNFEKNLLSDYYLDGEKARTEVLNATEVKGLARRVKSILNDKKIKVLSVENAWVTSQKKSLVIDRSGNTEFSYKIAEILNSKQVKHIIRKELGLDTTVIVGEDFEIKP